MCFSEDRFKWDCFGIVLEFSSSHGLPIQIFRTVFQRNLILTLHNALLENSAIETPCYLAILCIPFTHVQCLVFC
jgi:hypothetical protein